MDGKNDRVERWARFGWRVTELIEVIMVSSYVPLSFWRRENLMFLIENICNVLEMMPITPSRQPPTKTLQGRPPYRSCLPKQTLSLPRVTDSSSSNATTSRNSITMIPAFKSASSHHKHQIEQLTDHSPK